MPNRDLAYRAADMIEGNADNFDISQLGREGEPSCIAGHLLRATGEKHIPDQPTPAHIAMLTKRLGINEQTAHMLCMPMTPAANIFAPKGHPAHVDAQRAARALRRVGDGGLPNYESDIIEGRVIERV